MAEKNQVVHPIAPVYDNDSEILILGSFPSVKSREQGFFYGHPQNRFWKVLSAVYDNALPLTIEDKKSFLIRNHIAVWDVIASCEIEGSSDSTIKNVKENDLRPILASADIRKIYVNGRTAEKMFKKYTQKKIKRDCICLPSTSPANAAWNLERLIESWKVIKEHKMDIKERAAQAVRLKTSGCNCCQAVTAALADLTGMPKEQLIELSAGFGAGMGNMEGSCGALIGAVMAAGLSKHGNGVMPLARQINERFCEKCGSIVCKELKGRDTGKVLCSCDKCVENAVLIYGDVMGIK